MPVLPGEEMRLLKWLCELTVIAGLMFGMAYLFLLAWDATEFVNQAKRAARMDTMLYPEPQPNYYPQPTDLAKPKTKVFQDSSQPRKGE
jgi:hypothetical protein